MAGWGDLATLLNSVWDRFFSPRRLVINKRQRILKLEKEIEEYVENRAPTDTNRKHISDCMSELARLRRELDKEVYHPD